MITSTPPLSAEQQKLLDDLVLHWGEMGSRWGVNRAVAQIHALLFVSDSPLHAQEISERLSLARSNVSTGIRELQSWGIVSVIHMKGDRRDYFTCSKDPWEMFDVISERRVRTELEPTLNFLKSIEAAYGKAAPKQVRELSEFLESGVSFYRKMRRLPRAVVKQIMKLDSRVTRFLNAGRKDEI